ncbi:MAG: gamma-glutamyltransferase [Steroidobacteraceae bacterium]
MIIGSRWRRGQQCFLLLAWLFLALCASAQAQLKPAHAAIASAHPLATEAGLEILRRGGNAFDAAVAVSAALAVVEPSSSGLGGGGFWLLHQAAQHTDVMIDGREVAPLAATRDMFLDASGNPVPRRSIDTALAAGIPGQPAALAHMAQKYGRLPLRDSLQPAIRLARQGFPLYERLRNGLTFKRDLIAASEARKVFLHRGEVLPLGSILKQPELAATLETLAEKGADDFYKGATARKLVAGVRKLGGIWTLDDLRQYEVKERAPVVGTYRGARIVSAPPPSSGGVALIDALNILAGFDFTTLDSTTRKHLVIEAMRRVHRDRAEYLGDPDFVSVPVERLINPFYADGQRTSLRLDRATPSGSLPGITNAEPGPHTTHFSIIDAEGNRVAATMTLNFFFGSGLMVPGLGVLLNNEMDDFSIKPGVPNGFQLVGADANAIAPRKRMLSSMTPTFIERPDAVMIVGTPGGSYIMGMVLLASLDWLDGKSAEDIVRGARYHHQYLPDVVVFEPGALSQDEQSKLQSMGHQLKQLSNTYGNMQVVTWDRKSGAVSAASDPRGAGRGLVY